MRTRALILIGLMGAAVGGGLWWRSSGSSQSPAAVGVRGTRRPVPRPLIPVQDAASIPPNFVDIAGPGHANIEFRYNNDEVPGRFHLPESMGGAASWVDYDGDGAWDLYLTNGRPLDHQQPQQESVSELYRNLGNDRFVRVSLAANASIDAFGHGCSVGDFDSDGFPDLYLSNFGRNVLLQNNGDGTFQDVTSDAGVGDELWSFTGVWLDIDEDLDLDLYVVNYLDWSLSDTMVCNYDGDRKGYCGPGRYHAQPDRLYVNQGNGTFREDAAGIGLVGENGKGLVAIAADLNNDLKPEIYVGNDLTPNFLFTRLPADAPGEASLRFVEQGAISGVAVSGTGQNEATMGIACGDYNRDELPDLYLAHYYRHKNTMYTNQGDLDFQDDSYRTRVAEHSRESLGFGTVALDYDRDGWLDLFVANGHVLGPNILPYAMRAQILHNDKTGSFDDVSSKAGSYFQQLCLGRGAAGGDFDNDGDVDLAISHLDRRIAVLRNDTRTGRRYLGIELQTASRIPPVGGRIMVSTNGEQQVHPLVAGGTYVASHDPRLLFGVLDADHVDVQIHWASGRVDSFRNLGTDRYWLIIEGQSPQAPW